MAPRQWPRWEVFLRPRGAPARQHVGAVHAPDAELAVQLARDLFTRRSEGVGLWVARTDQVTVAGNRP